VLKGTEVFYAENFNFSQLPKVILSALPKEKAAVL
jgi:hypothetical protein